MQSSTLTQFPTTDNGLTNSDKISLGLGIGIGLPSFVVTIIGVWIGWKQLRVVYHKRKGIELNERKQENQVELEETEKQDDGLKDDDIIESEPQNN